MPIIDSRPVRIIAAALEAQERSERGGHRRFDYAALARRARAKIAHIEADAGGDDASSGTSNGAMPDSGLVGQTGDDDGGGDTRGRSPLDLSRDTAGGRESTLAQRVPSATLPVVDAMFRTQGQFLKLAATLAAEVASFCADPSITASGNWNVRLPLDRTILPDTTLFLSLSPFHLSLRFDTQNALSRQLLLDHSALLQRELDSLLRAWGASRDIELTVW